MSFVLMENSINETRICIHCNTEYEFVDEKYADEKTPTVFLYSSIRNQMYCPNCGNSHSELIKAPPAFEKRPTLKGEGREMLNRIKKRNYGNNMPDY